MKKKFIKFLKENNALIPFCVEHAKYAKKWNLGKGTISYLTRINPKSYKQWINHGLYWAETTEGEIYWFKLNNKWEKECNS